MDNEIGGENMRDPRFMVHCKPCAHTWVLAYLPMNWDKLNKMLKNRCPKCGENGKGRIFLATQEQAKEVRT